METSPARKMKIKVRKIQTPRQIVVIVLKFEKVWLYHTVMCQIDVDRMANRVDPDPTAPSIRSSLIWVHTVCLKLRIIMV